MRTVKSEFTEIGKSPGLIINQEDFYENRECQIRICKDNEDGTFQLTLERYNPESSRRKGYITLDFDESTTAQIYHLIGNSLGLVK